MGWLSRGQVPYSALQRLRLRRWPPGPMCPIARRPRRDWISVSGRGTLYSWVVAVHPVDPVLADQVPYVVGLVELEEGVRVVGNVEGCPPHEVTVGMPVEVFFEEVGDVRLPNFAPAHRRKEETMVDLARKSTRS